MSISSAAMSSRMYPVSNVQLGSGLYLTEPRLRVASGSQEDPVHHRRANKEAPREPEVVAPRPEPAVPGIPLTTEALAARDDSLEHLCRRVAVDFLSCSACPASSSIVVGVVGEQDDLKRRMDDYMLHEDYHKSIRGEDGEEPIEALGSPPQTDMDSYYYSGPPTDLADTALLPRRPRGNPWPTLSTPPCPPPCTETTTPAVLLLAPNGLKVTLRPGKAHGNLWMLPPPTASAHRRYHRTH